MEAGCQNVELLLLGKALEAIAALRAPRIIQSSAGHCSLKEMLRYLKVILQDYEPLPHLLEL